MSEMSKREQALILLEEVLLAARRGGEQAQVASGAHAAGRKAAYYDVLTVALEQAALLEIDPSEFGLGGYDPDQLLASRADGAVMGIQAA